MIPVLGQRVEKGASPPFLYLEVYSIVMGLRLVSEKQNKKTLVHV